MFISDTQSYIVEDETILNQDEKWDTIREMKCSMNRLASQSNRDFMEEYELESIVSSSSVASKENLIDNKTEYLASELSEGATFSTPYGMDIEDEGDSVTDLNVIATQQANQIKQYMKLVEKLEKENQELKEKVGVSSKEYFHERYLLKRNKELKQKIKDDRKSTTVNTIIADESISQNLKNFIILLLHKK